MVERSIVTIICLFLQLSAAFKSLMYPSLALSPPSLSICVRGVCMCECVHDFKSKNLIEFSDTHKSFECNRLIIFSCGWVINHFGFNLLRCCWFFLLFFLFVPREYVFVGLCSSFGISIAASQPLGHCVKALTVLFVCFSIISDIGTNSTYIVKSVDVWIRMYFSFGFFDIYWLSGSFSQLWV